MCSNLGVMLPKVPKVTTIHSCKNILKIAYKYVWKEVGFACSGSNFENNDVGWGPLLVRYSYFKKPKSPRICVEIAVDKAKLDFLVCVITSKLLNGLS